ncbi:MAG: hypothetical protein QM715_13640 [Nibricoccus sp.]
MSDAASKSGFLTTAAAVVGGFLIFVLILVIAYLPGKPAPLPEGTKTPQERAQILRDMRAKETAATTTYGWVDQSKGVVRIPVDRAMQLTIDELNAKK